MKLVIFTEGLKSEELKALDVLYCSNRPYTANFFARHGTDGRTIFVYIDDDGRVTDLTHGAPDYARRCLQNNPLEHRKVEPKFESSVIAVVPPLTIEAHGHTYRLVQD